MDGRELECGGGAATFASPGKHRVAAQPQCILKLRWRVVGHDRDEYYDVADLPQLFEPVGVSAKRRGWLGEAYVRDSVALTSATLAGAPRVLLTATALLFAAATNSLSPRLVTAYRRLVATCTERTA